MKDEKRLGVSENLGQFLLLITVNAFVGAMVGLERTILPSIAEEEFMLAAKSAVLSFIVVFGLTKAATNYFAGRMSDRYGRKPVLIAGWLVAAPVPLLLMWAPTWGWIVAVNALLGVSQGLTWSTTVIMKIDLAGPKQRGFAMGVNEFAGYLAVALSALATGYIASIYGLRPQPFYLGVGYVIIGSLLSVIFVKETKGHVAIEISNSAAAEPDDSSPAGNRAKEMTQGEVFTKTSFTDPDLSSASQAGFVNNLNDGMSWGLFPIIFAASGLSLTEIGWLAAIYPATWGIGQLFTGAASDRFGRKMFIVYGMWTQGVGIAVIALSSTFSAYAVAAFLMGAGTAMVYPTLLAAIGDVSHPSWRASAVGIYRLWRDSGYAAGAIVAGVIADYFGMTAAVWTIAALTTISGFVVLVRMSETLQKES